MSTKNICPSCRTPLPTDAPAGVCPSCALRAALEVEEGPSAMASSYLRRPSPPIPASDLARRLPELEGFELIGQGG
ncbi:MAG: hypothetical protein KDD47_16310, partial [Acidobacteria bacterium]|nr:hypothetical protein [Acidobacteriota bacterium]